MDAEQIRHISEQFPWATETTLVSLAGELSQQNMNLMQFGAIFGDVSNVNKKWLDRNAEDATDTASKAGKIAEKSAKRGNVMLSKIIRQADPANAIAEIAHESSKMLADIGSGISNFIPGKIGAVAKTATKAGGFAAVTVTGLSVIFAKLITEQEKQVRQLIDFGSIAGDVQLYTTLRASVASLGMGLKEYAEVTGATKPFLVSATGDVLAGQLKLAEWLHKIDQDKTFNDFGMAIQDQTRMLSQEFETLYQLGEITEINAMSKKRAMDGFKSANKLALFTANSLGLQRSESLRIRDEARNNVDIQQGLLQNADFIAENLGEQASKNISDAAGFLASLNEATFGKEFSEQFQQDTNATLADIRFDQKAANNISVEWMQKLSRIGGGALEEYIQLVEDTATGKIVNESQALERQRKLTKLIKDQQAKVSATDPLLFASNEIIAQAQLIPDSYFNADIDALKSDVLLAMITERADGTIDTLDNFSVAFMNVKETLTPGFKTMGKGFSVLTGNMLKFGKAISEFFSGGSEEFDKIYQDEVAREQSTYMATVTEKNISQEIEKTNARIIETEAERADIIKRMNTQHVDYDDMDEFDLKGLKGQLSQLDEDTRQLTIKITELQTLETSMKEKEGAPM